MRDFAKFAEGLPILTTRGDVPTDAAAPPRTTMAALRST
jgi:hypothetical protein